MISSNFAGGFILARKDAVSLGQKRSRMVMEVMIKHSDVVSCREWCWGGNRSHMRSFHVENDM